MTVRGAEGRVVARQDQGLVRALDSAFLRAHESGFGSISFPAVSSGIFAVPLEVCARAYVRAVREFLAAHSDTSLRKLRLCLFEGPLVALVEQALARRP